MSLATILASALVVQAPVPAPAVEVAYREMNTRPAIRPA